MHSRTRQAHSTSFPGIYSAFLPALFALAQRAFMRIEIFFFPLRSSGRACVGRQWER